MAKTRSVREVTSQIKKLPEKFTTCRDMRHAWATENDYHVYTQYQEAKGSKSMFVARDLVCMRCGALRHEIYLATKSRGLERVSMTYSYPDGYMIPGMPSGVSPQAILAQMRYRRAMEAVAHAQPGDRERGD